MCGDLQRPATRNPVWIHLIGLVLIVPVQEGLDDPIEDGVTMIELGFVQRMDNGSEGYTIKLGIA
jgi:hypothetical protein